MSELQTICKEIKKCRAKRQCDANEIVCAKRKVLDYVKNDDNKLLKLKAQIKVRNDSQVSDYTLISFAVTVFTFVLTIIYNTIAEQNPEIYKGYAFLYVFIVFILISFTMIFQKTKKSNNEWMKYIETVVENMKMPSEKK